MLHVKHRSHNFSPTPPWFPSSHQRQQTREGLVQAFAQFLVGKLRASNQHGRHTVGVHDHVQVQRAPPRATDAPAPRCIAARRRWPRSRTLPRSSSPPCAEIGTGIGTNDAPCAQGADATTRSPRTHCGRRPHARGCTPRPTRAHGRTVRARVLACRRTSCRSAAPSSPPARPPSVRSAPFLPSLAASPVQHRAPSRDATNPGNAFLSSS